MKVKNVFLRILLVIDIIASNAALIYMQTNDSFIIKMIYLITTPIWSIWCFVTAYRGSRNRTQKNNGENRK